MPLDSKLKLDDIARLQTPGAAPTKHRVELLHQALGTLGLPVDPGEVDEAKLGKTTTAAVKVLQERAGLDQTGKFNKSTVDALKVHVEDQLLTATSYRAGRIQQLLTDAGVTVEAGELKTRTFGPSTRDQLKEFATQAGLRDDGLVTQDVITALRAHALTRKLSSKTQTSKLQKTMLRAARARNIDLHIDGTEMRTKELGPSTQAAIRTLQARFGLPATGTMDPETFDRVHAAAASKPRKPVLVSAPDPTALKPIPRALCLNATNKDVPVLQRTLAFLGHGVNETEFKETRFGASTRGAVLAFQKSAGLPETGHVDKVTLAALNQAVIRANPAAAATTARIRGTVRDTAWAGIKGASVELRTRAIGDAGVVLGQRTTLANGFFDLPYTPPVDAATGKSVSPLLLTVIYRDPAGAEIGRKNLVNPSPMAWANFTQGDRPYAGPSDYEVRLAAISAAAKGAPLILLTETADHPDISHVALACGLAQDDVMRMVLAARVSSKLAGGALDIAVVYAFLEQSLPPSLPAELLASTNEWELIDQLVENTANGIVFMESPLQEAALDSALAENLIPVTVGARRAAITAALAANRTAFALHKPLLVGNGNLASVLGTSSIPADQFDTVAEVFVTSRGFGAQFWADVNAALPGLDTQVQDFKQSVDVGLVVKNHLPTMTFMKEKIADPADTRVNSARDLAKLTPQEWSDYISANGNAIPDGTDGASLPARRETFARTLAAQSERIFPTVAFVAEVGRSTQTALTKVDQVAALVDAHEELNLRTDNVDGFVASNAIAVDDDVRADLRVLQRAHRLAPTAATGRALLDNHLHSSMQILSVGKAELVTKLGASGVDQPTALSIHGYAMFQYANVLQRLGDFRAEIHQSDPAAVVPQAVTAAERADLLGQIPDLELLFGPLDVCDCAHCASVYGPAAYLADLLRFLDAHPSQVAGRTVREILTDRRPDLVTTKLNCPNTETAVPYIDLVCEILEAAVTGADPDGQTTRPAEELRAVPEHQRDGAYDTLRTADFPMTGVFDLWQEDTRMLLEHLGVPRWRLMGVFGDPDADAASIAAEQLGISSHETSIITTAAATSVAQQKFWGLDPDRAEIPVLDVMGHAHLRYQQILVLRTLTWINPPGAPAPLQLARPVGSASLDDQRLTGITVDTLDRIHRLLRLWRHVPWDLWELDLLVRTARIGGGAVNGPALVALRDAAQLQSHLNVPVETLASWFGDLPRQGRPDPADPTEAAMSAYAALFCNPAVLNPPDPAFAAPGGGALAADRHPALLAALSVTESELTQLLAKVGATFDVEHLSALVRWSTLARGLDMRVTELLALATLVESVVADPFAAPAALLEFLDVRDVIRTVGIAPAELDALLHARPDSPYLPGDDATTDAVRTLRESLRTAAPDSRAGAAISHVATTFGVPAEHAALLMNGLTVTGEPLATRFTDAAIDAHDDAGNYVTELSAAAQPALYTSYALLHKVVRLMHVHGVTALDDLRWLLDNAADVGVLAFGDLPVSAEPPADRFGDWLALARLRLLRATVPSAPEVLRLGSKPASTLAQLRTAAAGFGLSADDLAKLDGGRRAPYRDLSFLNRLCAAAAQIKRLGVSATTCFAWADRDTDAVQADIARQVRQAAKSKYEAAAWLSTVMPMQDNLRERKRDGLLAHLIEKSLRAESPSVTVDGKVYVNRKYWRNSEDVFNYFLIDVDMSACQLTSRIQEAISAVQTFVQRCLLNVEKPEVLISGAERADQVSLDAWSQWKWMKNYRIWEANRKIFLYPENWIEPALRDDKSPFFVELENELLQGDITDARAETALRHYLEKVHEVHDLEVVGMYHDVDDDSPFDNLPPSINRVHVVGRTRTDTPSYFYRSFDLNTGAWAAWERIDLDITGEHVVPVVYNRALHLFWLVITDKPQKVRRQPAAQQTTSTSDAPEPPKQLEIKLAWSVRREDGWSPRRVTPNPLVHPWQRPAGSYTLKPRYKSRENQLWLDLYVSTSLEFNNIKFYDPYTGQFAYLTGTRFDETARPWHSSSFVFDGNVVATKLKPLRGHYHVLDAAGLASPTLTQTTSYQYVHDAADDRGRMVLALTGGYEIAPRMALPEGMHFQTNRLVNNTYKMNSGRLSVLESGASVALLNAARTPFSLSFSTHHVQLDTAAYERSPFFYSDTGRTYFVESEWVTVQQSSTEAVQRLRYRFAPFSHQYTALFLRELNRGGVPGLLRRAIQRFPQTFYPTNSFNFGSYQPTSAAIAEPTAQTDIVDFSPRGATSIYNWELFFHAPFLIACKLTANQRFEEAMKWFHYVFDPTDTEQLSAPQRFWVTKPFFDMGDAEIRKQRIQSILDNVESHAPEVRAWKNDPFKPFLVARTRPVAFQKAVVMKYIDNLIAWGDQLYRMDTLESINEARMLYVLAHELLGRRPEHVPAAPRADQSYAELTASSPLDPFGNKRVDVLLENFVARPATVVDAPPGTPPLPELPLLYFGIPANDQLEQYWTTVEGRLFQIRHCMNLAGQVRQLPPFAPPIDPAVLVRAVAAGVDLDSVLAPSGAAASPYRFRTLVGKALEVCAEVRVLGQQMIGALEKRDAEALALLTAGNDVALQDAITLIRKQQITEANLAAAAMEKGFDAIDERIAYFGGIPRMNDWETAGVVVHGLGLISEILATVLSAVAGPSHLIPQIEAGAAGFGGSPTLTVKFGGTNVGSAASSFAALFNGLAGILHQGGHMLETQGMYTRQHDRNQHEFTVAQKDRAHLSAQLEASKVRITIAEKELEAHELHIDHVGATAEYLKSKYTNQQLYDWMVGQLATVYFRAYQLAFDLGKQAERAFEYELGADPSRPTFVQFGYWDSLKKGLLAGERLTADLRRMEAAYLDTNRRRLELTRSFSLAAIDPMALVALRSSGSCNVTFGEWLYDLDHPGHFQRRLRSVAISVPCVTGPYTNVNATLTLTGNGVRLIDDPGGDYGDPLVTEDARRFAAENVPVTMIATSHGRADSGMFDVRGDDDRYLPFEGAGAVSKWAIALKKEHNQFDLATVTDVILHIEYTALPGSAALAAAATTALNTKLPKNGARLLALDAEFAGAWYRFEHPDAGAEQIFAIDVGMQQVPFAIRRAAGSTGLVVTRADLVVESAATQPFDVRVAGPGNDLGDSVPLTVDGSFGDLFHAVVTPGPGTPVLGAWQLSIKRQADDDFTSLPAGLVTHAYLVLQFGTP